MTLSKTEIRIQKEKEALIKEFEQTPIASVACKKANISRATYYRWLNEDSVFCEKVEEAQEKGTDYLNDLCETFLINSAQNGSVAAAKYWLEHNHKKYNPMEIEASNDKAPRLLLNIGGMLNKAYGDKPDEGSNYENSKAEEDKKLSAVEAIGELVKNKKPLTD